MKDNSVLVDEYSRRCSFIESDPAPRSIWSADVVEAAMSAISFKGGKKHVRAEAAHLWAMDRPTSGSGRESITVNWRGSGSSCSSCSCRSLAFKLNVVHQSEWHLSVAQKIWLSS